MKEKETIYETKERISENALIKCFKSTLSPSGTLIMSFKLTVGRVSFLGMDAVHNEAIISIIPIYDKDNSIKNWLFNILGIITNLTDQTDAIKGSTLNKDKLSSLLVPIPSISEQQRILSKLYSFEPLIKDYEEKEKQLSNLESSFESRLKASVLQYAIEGKLVKQDSYDEPASVLLERIKKEKERLIREGKIKRDKHESKIVVGDDKNYYACYGINAPSQWCICCLSSISIKIVDGNHNPPRGIDHLSEYKMLSSLNIDNNGLVNLSSVRYLTREQFIDENKRTNIQLNDILLTTVGSLGRCFVLNKVIPVAFQRSVSVITTLINPQFLRLFFLSPSFQKYMQLNAKGTAQKGFYLNQLSDSLIAFPSLKEQDLIVKMVESILKVLS